MMLLFAQKLKVGEGSAIYQYIATFTGCLSVISIAMHFGWTSPSLPILLGPNSHITMTNSDGSWLAVTICIGAAPGALLAASLVNRIGRRITILLTAPGFLVGWLMIAFATTTWELYLARFIAGAADGALFTAFPMYVGEIASQNIRGLLGSSISLSMILGMLLVNIIGSYMSIMNTALICGSLAPVFFVTFFFMPESPYFLVLKGRVDEATRSLQIFRQSKDVTGEIYRIMEAVKEYQQQQGKCYDLFTVRSNRKAVLIVFGLRAFQQLSGTTIINFYAQSIFSAAGTDMLPSTATIIFFTLQLACGMASSFLVDKVGRKPLLIVSIIGSGVTLALEGAYFYLSENTSIDVSNLKLVPLIALLSYVVIFNIGMGVIPVLLLGEMFPTSVKGFALCLADIWYGIIVTIISKLFQITQDGFGIAVPFFAFAICCLLGLIFICLVVPETKGKTLEDIQRELKGLEKVEHDEKHP